MSACLAPGEGMHMGSTLGGRMPRLALCLFATIAMVLGLVPCAGLKEALADDAKEYPLWVGEAQVTSKNLQGEGWRFEPATNTLTLDGYSYAGEGHSGVVREDNQHAAIFWADINSTLAIVLKGDNNVVVTADDDSDDYCYAIFSVGGLMFSGTGDLVANAGGIERGVAGIYADDDISIATEGGSISAKGYVVGIDSYEGTIAVGKNAGTIIAETTGGDDAALYAIYAEYGDVRIDGGMVAAKGYRGISAEKNIVINGGEVNAQSVLSHVYRGSIMDPSGIYSENGTITINDGMVVAKGHQFGIYCGFIVREDEEDEEGAQNVQDATKAADDIVINGGSVYAEAIGSGEEGVDTNIGAIGICADGSGVLTVMGGSVQAVGSGAGALGVSARGSVTIGEGTTSFDTSGMAGAFKADVIVKNAVAGIGWTDVAGTEGKATIEANADGQTLNGYKRVLFPAASASVTTPPTGKSLAYSGKPQELVDAGVADGGELQYSLDGTTYDAQLPTATEIGSYTVYYKVVGDASHTDTEANTVTSVIQDYPAPTMSNSKGGSFVSTSDEITYTISQKVPVWATSVRTWVDLENVLQYTVDADGVVVTCDDAAVDSAQVTIDGQRLTIQIDDVTSLRDQSIQIAYKANLRSDANLDPYLNETKDTASVPYQASSSFDGEHKVVSSDKEYVKFKVGSSSGSSDSSGSSSSGSSSSSGKSSSTSKSSTANTGDAMSFTVPAVLAALGAVTITFAALRRVRDSEE